MTQDKRTFRPLIFAVARKKKVLGANTNNCLQSRKVRVGIFDANSSWILLHTRKWDSIPEEHAPSIRKENTGPCGTMFPWGGFALESCAGVAELWSGVDTMKDKPELSPCDNPVSNIEGILHGNTSDWWYSDNCFSSCEQPLHYGIKKLASVYLVSHKQLNPSGSSKRSSHTRIPLRFNQNTITI